MEKLKKIWRTAKLFLLGLLVGALLTALALAPPLMRWVGANTGSARAEQGAPEVSAPRPVFVRVAGAAAGAGVSADGRTWVAPAAGEAELSLLPGAYELRAALANKTVFTAWTLYQTGADTQAPVLDLSLAPECPEFIILEKNYGEDASLPLPLSGAATVTLEKSAPGLSVRADEGGLFRLEAGPAVRPGFYHVVLTAHGDGGETVTHAGLRVRAAGAAAEIAGAGDLEAMAYNLNGHFRLTADIDLSAIPWRSVGTEEYPFTGVFEGGGHEIRGLSAPLFGVVQSAEISGVALSAPAVAEGETAAALAVVARDSFIHDAAVLGGSVRAAAAAGCVYRAEGSVLSGLVNSAAVEAEAPAAARPRAGGLTAVVSGRSLVLSCVNGGAVSGNYLAGGIAALAAESDISRCFAGGSVRAPLAAGLPPAGSVVHLAEWGRVTDCYYLENEDETLVGAGAGNLSPAVVAAVTPLTAEEARAAAELSRLGEFTGPAPEWTFHPEWAGPLPGGAAAIFPAGPAAE